MVRQSKKSLSPTKETTPLLTASLPSVDRIPYTAGSSGSQDKTPAPTDEGYAAWVSRYGTDTDGIYREALRAANAAYARALATYGALGETLGRAGLTGSGYGDYLTGVAYAARASAEDAALKESYATEQKNRQSYAAYLTEQQDRAKDLLTTLRKEGVTDADLAYTYAKTCGISDENARTISTLIGKMSAAGTTASLSEIRERVTVLQYVIRAGLTRDAAYAYAISCGIRQDVAKELADAAEKAATDADGRKLYDYYY